MATRKTAPTKRAAPRKTNGRASSSAAESDERDNSRWADVQLPAGFKPIAGDYGQDWDYENDPLLVGTISGETRVVESGKGKNLRTSRVVNVVDESTGVIYAVWESASLHAWFDAIMPDDRVAIVFKGFRPSNKGNDMKVFYGSIEPKPEGADGEPTTPRKPAPKRQPAGSNSKAKMSRAART